MADYSVILNAVISLAMIIFVIVVFIIMIIESTQKKDSENFSIQQLEDFENKKRRLQNLKIARLRRQQDVAATDRRFFNLALIAREENINQFFQFRPMNYNILNLPSRDTHRL